MVQLCRAVATIPKRFSYFDPSLDGPQRGVHRIEVHSRRGRTVRAIHIWPDGVTAIADRPYRQWARWYATLNIIEVEPFPLDLPDDQVFCRERATAIVAALEAAPVRR